MKTPHETTADRRERDVRKLGQSLAAKLIRAYDSPSFQQWKEKFDSSMEDVSMMPAAHLTHALYQMQIHRTCLAIGLGGKVCQLIHDGKIKAAKRLEKLIVECLD